MCTVTRALFYGNGRDKLALCAIRKQNPQFASHARTRPLEIKKKKHPFWSRILKVSKDKMLMKVELNRTKYKYKNMQR